MSNLIINIRIGLYHIQVVQPSDWWPRGWDWPIKISKNEYHRGYPHGFFQVHEWRL